MEPRRDQLDGLRAVIFALVFTIHHVLDPLEFFTYALPVFFVMSGFLITRVLWQCQADTIWGRLRIFYIRRMIRIFPAYYTVIALILLFDPVMNPWSYVLYYLNVKLFAVSLDQASLGFINWWANWETQDLHLWSLAVEEQYYLLAPLVIFLVPQRRLWMVFAGTIVGAILLRQWFITHYPTVYFGFLLSTCVEYFAWGSLFAYVERWRGARPAYPAVWTIYVPVAIGLTLISIEYGYDLDGYYHCITTHFTSAVAPLIGLMIWGIWMQPGSHWLVRFLNLRPLVYLGLISYPMYLVHLSSFAIYRRFFGAAVRQWLSDPTALALAYYFGTLALTIAGGSLLWHFVEVPAARLRRSVPLDASRVRSDAYARTAAV